MADFMTSPTPFQLAFALTLNRAKPPNISVREYILTLRKHTYSGPRPQFSATYEESQTKYINAAFYFESLLKEEQKKNDDLRNRITNLERRQNATEQLSKKTANYPIMAKAETIARTESAEDCSNYEFGVPLPSEPSNASLLRHVYNVHMSLQESPCSCRKITRLIIRTCNAFGRAMDPGEPNHGEITRQDFNLRTGPLKRIISLIFTAFDRLVASDGSITSSHEIQSQLPLVTYHIVSLFRRILDSTASVESKLFESMILEPPAHGIVNSLTQLSNSYVKILAKHHAIASEGSVEKHKQAYDDLLEGTLYILLKRAGTVLYTSTFSTPRAHSIEAEITTQNDKIESTTGIQRETRYNPATEAQPESQELSNRSPVATLANRNADKPSDYTSTQLTLHNRHLVSLIQAILPLYYSCHNHQSKQTNTATDADANSRASTAEPEAEDANAPAMRSANSTTVPTCGDFVQQRLDILQNTLVSGVFGSSEAGGLGEMLRSPNIRPREEGVDGDAMGEDDEDGDGEGQGDWFTRKMWELVGWDILARGLV